MGGRQDDSSMFDQVNERAVNWAKTQAATEPEPHRLIWALVADCLAGNVGPREIVERAIDAGYRPDEAGSLIGAAIAQANSMASLLGYMDAQKVGDRVRKVWLNAPGSCAACAANAKQGPIPLEKHFKSGHLTPPAHFGCRCAIAGRVEG